MMNGIQKESIKRYLRMLCGPYFALVLILLVCCGFNEQFRNPANLMNVIRQSSCSGIIALGMTFVIIGGGIDLSVGSLLAVAGVVAIMTMNVIVSPVLGLLAGIAVALGIGLGGAVLNGSLVSVGRIPPFIATLGTLSIFRSLSLYFADAGTIRNTNPYYEKIYWMEVFGIPLPIIILFALTILFWLIMTMTGYGRHVCALGSNERVARFAGIRTGLVKFSTYLIVGLCCGISAVLLSGKMNAIPSSSAGLYYELDAIAAVIIGGTAMNGGRGSLWGTLAGIFILAIVTNALDMWGVSVNLQGLVKGLVIIIAVLIQRKDQTR